MAAERKQFFLGGQAVLEGVMMRSPFHYAVAVRRKSGEITSQSGVARSLLLKHKWLNIPFLRGTFALIEMMSLGLKTLRFSTDIVLQDEDAERMAREGGEARPMDVGKTTAWMIAASLCFALLFKYTVFFALPYVASRFTVSNTSSDLSKNLIEGLIRILFFVVFLSVINLSAELRRVFEYHGAEHKVVNLVEAYEELTVANAQRHSRLHRRCGTTFLFIVLIVGILLFALCGRHDWPTDLALRFVLIPVIAGAAYEVIRLTRYPWAQGLATVLLTPGMGFQYLTTREPNAEQLEVALEAMKLVLNLERETVEEFVPEAIPVRAVPAAASTFR